MFTLITRRRLVALVVAVAAALLVAETAALAAIVTRSGGPVKAVKAVTVSYDETSSVSYIDVLNMSLTMSVPSGEKALFLITVSAQTGVGGADPYLTGYIRVAVDGDAATPNESAFDTHADGNGYVESNSRQFVIGPLAAGQHNFVLQFRTNSSAANFALTWPMMSVLRAKVS